MAVKIRKGKPVQPIVSNNTIFTMEDIGKMALIAKVANKWRVRMVDVYQHPTEEDMVISVGRTMNADQGMTYNIHIQQLLGTPTVTICQEAKSSFQRQIEYFKETGRISVIE